MTKEEAIQNIIDRIEEIKEECCAINLDDAKLALVNGYYGERVAVIAGDSQEWGQDAGEIIIREATVIEVLA